MIHLFSKKRSSVVDVIALATSIILLYILVYSLELQNSVQTFTILIVILIALIGGYNLCQKFDRTLLIKYVLLLGFAMRIGYMLYTPATLRPHDLNDISIYSNGHAAYILNILAGNLPISNEGQFYHPPLYHILSGLIIFILQPLLNFTNELDIINCARIVSCFFSCLTLYLVQFICTEMKIKTTIPLVLVAFLPNFYLMGGRVNNDSISMFFMIVIILYTIKWSNNQTIKNTVILALCFGLGMMSKMSVALFSIPTGIVMIHSLIKSISRNNHMKILKNLFIFAIISLPLGLAYPIRNLMLFDQPFNYVLDVGGSGFMSHQYPYIQRFLSFPISKLFSPIYNNPFTDYNVWMYLLKGGLFGEFRFNIDATLTSIMLFIYILITVLLILSTIRALMDGDSYINFLMLSVFTLMMSYIAFNIKYPYGCTMDFRYIAPVFVITSLFLGRFLDRNKNKQYGIAIYRISASLVILFSVLSITIFCMI